MVNSTPGYLPSIKGVSLSGLKNLKHGIVTKLGRLQAHLILRSRLMEASPVAPEAVSLISRLTGQDLAPQDLKPSIVFLAALVIVLSGVIVIDGAATDEEKQHLKTLLKAFVPSNSVAYQFMRLVVAGARQHQIYLDPHSLWILSRSFSLSESLLVVGLSYDIAAVDGDINLRERLYLQAIAQRLDLDPHYLAVLDAGFCRQEIADQDALNEVRSLLSPSLLNEVNPLSINAANLILAALSTAPSAQPSELPQCP